MLKNKSMALINSPISKTTLKVNISITEFLAFKTRSTNDNVNFNKELN